MNARDRLWDFVCDLYRRPGVAAACLALQDENGAEVNRLLYGCWAARHGVGLDAAALDRMAAATGAWQTQVILPLRELRRRLRHDPQGAPAPAAETIRRAIESVEIEAERVALDAMAAAAPIDATMAADSDLARLAESNLRCVLVHAGAALDPATMARISTVVAGCRIIGQPG